MYTAYPALSLVGSVDVALVMASGELPLRFSNKLNTEIIVNHTQ